MFDFDQDVEIFCLKCGYQKEAPNYFIKDGYSLHESE